MPRFRDLSQVIRANIEAFAPNPSPGTATPLALQMGQQVPISDFTDTHPDVFRWGFSAWGAPIIGQSKPTDN